MTHDDPTAEAIQRPSMQEILLDIAEVMAERGTCTRAQVGAIVARDGRILSSGYNGTPAGMPHCEHPAGERSHPGGGGGCPQAVHAEANAIAYAARHGVPLAGASLFCSLSPCLACAQLIVNAGIREVYFRRQHRVSWGLELLVDANILVTQLAYDTPDAPLSPPVLTVSSFPPAEPQ